jgi:hypothetical protein
MIVDVLAANTPQAESFDGHSGQVPDLFPCGEVHYILRLYLPYWRFEERVEEVIAWCHATQTRQVMLFTDAQFIVWNQLTLAEAQREVDTMCRAKARLAEAGIRVGINSSYNQQVSQRDHRGHLDYDYWATRADGTCDYRGPCLLDPKLERYLIRFYRLLAGVGADFIFVDDDHRYMLLGDRQTWGCCCDLHVHRFGEVTDQTWTRQSLQHALQHDQAVRAAWIDFLGAQLVHLAQVIERAVHAVNPQTKVGMMIPSVHCLPPVGHRITNVLAAFHPGPGKPLVRPCIGGYQDWQRRHLFAGLFYPEFIQHTLGDAVEYAAEIETCPGTRLSKSMAVVRYQMTQAFLHGMNAAAISAASYVGDSPFLEEDFAPMLSANRRYFTAIRHHAPRPGTRKGIQLHWEFDSAARTPGSISDPADLYWPAFTCTEILGHLGIPHTFDPSPVSGLIGDSVRCMSADAIRNTLAGGVLLDATAVHALHEMGYGEWTGCAVGAAVTQCSAEVLSAPEFSGPYADCYIPIAFPREGSVRQLAPDPACRIISHLIDHDRQPVAPGVVLYTNALGGRVAALPYALHGTDHGNDHLICYHRRYQLQQLLRWMCPDVLPVWVERPTDAGLKVWEDEQRLTVCLTNLSFDTTRYVELLIHAVWNPAHASCIDGDGSLVSLADHIQAVPSASGRRWMLSRTIPPFDSLIMIVKRSALVS